MLLLSFFEIEYDVKAQCVFNFGFNLVRKQENLNEKHLWKMRMSSKRCNVHNVHYRSLGGTSPRTETYRRIRMLKRLGAPDTRATCWMVPIGQNSIGSDFLHKRQGKHFM